MANDTEELIKELKKYRDGMVARNLPFQWISDIITKWEMKKVTRDVLTDLNLHSTPCLPKVLKVSINETHVSILIES